MGRLRGEIEQLFVRQSREPAAVQMDLRAAIGANEATRTKIHALIDRYGADVVRAVMEGTLDSGERLMRERLRSIPDGTWSHRAYTEAALSGDREIYRYQVNITKCRDRLIVDNAGTDPQAGSINVTFAAFGGAVLAALTQQMVSDLAGAYGGAYRCVEFRPVPGLLNCANHPAAVSPSGALTTAMQLNSASIAVGKMLACGDEEVRELTLGPCIPHFYSPILAGLRKDGGPFLFPNTNGMMGSIAGRPSRDGVDVGGHWWIPEGIAFNSEDIESQQPLLLLHRKLLDQGLDGSGRHRSGAGFREAIVAYGAEVAQVLLHEGESFVKGQGLLGGSPGSPAAFRVKHRTDLLEQLAGGRVPASFDEIGGDEEQTAFKGPPVVLVEGELVEWTSPSTAGYGDPLLRDPEAVLDDVLEGYLAVEAADRVYGVVIVDERIDEAASDARRRAIRSERLGSEAGDPVAAPAGAQPVGDVLRIVDGRWWCNGADLGPTSASYRDAAPMRERPIRAIGPEYATWDHDMADRMVFREFLCPVTGLLIDTEIARKDDAPLRDMVVAA